MSKYSEFANLSFFELRGYDCLNEKKEVIPRFILYHQGIRTRKDAQKKYKLVKRKPVQLLKEEK